MQLSEILGLPVLGDGDSAVGTVIDVRVALPSDEPPRLIGLLVSPDSRTSYLGYERAENNRPRVLSAFLRWRHRRTFLTGWEDVAVIDHESVHLRPNYTRYSPFLHNERDV